MNNPAGQIDDARGFARIPYGGRVQYCYGANDHGIGEATDVCRGGLKITIGRYLRPGTHILVTTPDCPMNGRPLELKGQIVWCRPEKAGLRFSIGVRVIYDEPDAVAGISALVHHAIATSGLLRRTPVRRAGSTFWNFCTCSVADSVPGAQAAGDA